VFFRNDVFSTRKIKQKVNARREFQNENKSDTKKQFFKTDTRRNQRNATRNPRHSVGATLDASKPKSKSNKKHFHKSKPTIEVNIKNQIQNKSIINNPTEKEDTHTLNIKTKTETIKTEPTHQNKHQHRLSFQVFQIADCPLFG
jgi:hypothetical protein